MKISGLTGFLVKRERVQIACELVAESPRWHIAVVPTTDISPPIPVLDTRVPLPLGCGITKAITETSTGPLVHQRVWHGESGCGSLSDNPPRGGPLPKRPIGTSRRSR